MQRKSNYQNVTFTDAALTCQEATRNKFDENLKSVMVDNHSSRYEHNNFLYKIFLQADTTDKANKNTLYYINCYVKASNGSIDTLDVFENKDTSKSGLGTNPGNFFNWPRWFDADLKNSSNILNLEHKSSYHSSALRAIMRAFWPTDFG